MKNSSKSFGILCLSSGTGLLLYWTMFLLSNFFRAQRFGVDVPNMNVSTGIIGSICIALFAFGVINVGSKPTKTIVLVRTPEGKVSSIFNTDYGLANAKANFLRLGVKLAPKPPQPRKRVKTKCVLGIVALTALVGSYPLTALAMGFRIQDIVSGSGSPLMVVSSQSMQPTLNYGDIIVMKAEKAEDIGVGDVIAFNVPSPYDRLSPSPTVHRVVGKWSDNGEFYYKTKGDSNSDNDAWNVTAATVAGEYTQLKVPYVGSLVIFLKSPLGLASLTLTFVSFLLYGYYRKKERSEA